MEEPAAIAAIIAGAWLLIYQALIRTPLRNGAVMLTRFFSGASLLVLEPLVKTTQSLESYLIFGVTGGALSVLFGDAASAFFAAISLGVGLTQWLWNLTLCSSVADDLMGTVVHTAVLTIISFVAMLFFICTPIGIVLVELLMFPLLGAMLVATGASALLAEPSRSLINPFPGTCPGSTGLGFEAFAAWLFVGLLASAIQIKFRMIRIQKAEQESDTDDLNRTSKNGMLTSLLQTSRNPAGAGGAPGFAKPEGDLSRVHAIARAIPEGSDMSHLTETEKKLVEICRTDSFERDRILFGGGLC